MRKQVIMLFSVLALAGNAGCGGDLGADSDQADNNDNGGDSGSNGGSDNGSNGGSDTGDVVGEQVARGECDAPATFGDLGAPVALFADYTDNGVFLLYEIGEHQGLSLEFYREIDESFDVVGEFQTGTFTLSPGGRNDCNYESAGFTVCAEIVTWNEEAQTQTRMLAQGGTVTINSLDVDADLAVVAGSVSGLTFAEFDGNTGELFGDPCQTALDAMTFSENPEGLSGGDDGEEPPPL